MTLSPDDAVGVFEELLPAQNVSFKIGLKLKLPYYIVEAIHSKDLQPDEYLLKVLIKFLQRVEPRPTWRVIVEALRSPAVNLPALAESIEATHIPSANSRATTPISLPVEPSSQKSVETVRYEIENLKDNFLQLTCETIALLSEKEKKDDNFLKNFTDYLINFPVAKKAIHVKFFLKNEDEILRADNIRKLFAILGRYCNYRNYEIIVHIVKKFGDVKLKRGIRIYCDSIKKFETSTTVSVYLKAISVLPDSQICKGFEQMAMRINKSTDECSLHEIRQLKEAIAESAAVHSYSVYMESVTESSVLVQFLVHPACTQMVHAAITPDFSYLYNVTVVEISDYGNYLCGFCQRMQSNHWSSVKIIILFPVVPLPTPPAMAVTEGGEDDDQTGDSGMGTGYGSVQYLMRDFLPGIVHSPAAGPTKFLSIFTPISTSLKRTLQLLTLGTHAQRGLLGSVCVCVC